jgi:hypothetical protein
MAGLPICLFHSDSGEECETLLSSGWSVIKQMCYLASCFRQEWILKDYVFALPERESKESIEQYLQKDFSFREPYSGPDFAKNLKE